jgi:hypothetical protein
MVANNLSLFTGQAGFEELEKVVQMHDARKRGKYNKKIQTNNQYQFLLILYNLINPFSYIAAIYNHLAVKYVQMPLFSKEEAAFCYKGLNVYYSVYQPEDYTYYDYPTQGLEGKDETVSGEDFQVFEAELAGTENFNVNDRLDLHTRLIDLLEQGVQLEQATSMLQPEIERIKQIYDKEKANTLARDKDGIFKRV